MSDDLVADLLAEYKAALDEAARLRAEADYQDHQRKRVLAANMNDTQPQWKADANARTSPAYVKHLDLLRDAKLAARVARSRVKHIERRLDIWLAREATRRVHLQRGDQDA